MRSAEAVLVVDDDAALRRLLSAVLAGHGYRVLEAGTGREALDVCTRNAAALGLLITDVEMPEMRGPELVGELNRLGICPPVIYISGFCTDESLRELSERGPVNFLRKPFPPGSLLETVHRIVESTSPSDVRKKPPGAEGSPPQGSELAPAAGG